MIIMITIKAIKIRRMVTIKIMVIITMMMVMMAIIIVTINNYNKKDCSCF